MATAAAAKSLQSCLTLCDPIDVSPSGSLSLGFSRQEHWSRLPFPSPMHDSEKVKVKSLSCVRLLATPWTAAYQAPPSMGFSRQEYWSGVPLPSPKIMAEFLKFHQVSCHTILFFLIIYLFIFLFGLSGLSCSMHDLCCSEGFSLGVARGLSSHSTWV